MLRMSLIMKGKKMSNRPYDANLEPDLTDVMFWQKLHPDAVEPTLAKEGDAGYDVIAINGGDIIWQTLPMGLVAIPLYVEYKTGIAIEPPEGYHTEIFPRSSIRKYDLMLCNSIPLIDGTYRGELILCFNVVNCQGLPTDSREYLNGPDQFIRESYKLYQKGDKIAQVVIRKTIHKRWVRRDTLSETSRGSGGFGSTGK